MAPGVASLRGVGTGKGLAGGLIAAECLATARRMDLYRIDLSSVVSKYIVETEDQMRRVFYVAEKIGAVHFRRSGYAFIATTVTPSSRSQEVLSLMLSSLCEARQQLRCATTIRGLHIPIVHRSVGGETGEARHGTAGSLEQLSLSSGD